jgi:pimeloyl-ACP methyl ester carboxylesterase
MTTYVLVGGAWLGGWCWKSVARLLRDNGHDGYPATLTGLGERAHLASPEVDLETHITDVVNLIEYEDLHDVVLLGHSYAGLVDTGVAERISELVYLVDTGPLPNGTTLIDTLPPRCGNVSRGRSRSWARAGGGPCRHPKSRPASAAWKKGDEEDLKLLYSRATPQPFDTYTRPLRLTNPAREALPKVGILCNFSLDQVQQMIATGHPLFRELSDPNWRFVELSTGHWPMFSRPGELAELLLDLPSRQLPGTMPGEAYETGYKVRKW